MSLLSANRGSSPYDAHMLSPYRRGERWGENLAAQPVADVIVECRRPVETERLFDADRQARSEALLTTAVLRLNQAQSRREWSHVFPETSSRRIWSMNAVISDMASSTLW